MKTAQGILTRGELRKAVQFAEKATGSHDLQCSGTIYRMEEAWTDKCSYFAVRICASDCSYVGNVRFMSWTADRRKSKALRMETRAEQAIITDSRDSRDSKETETDSRGEKERLTKESIALGVDVFSIMLQGDVTEGERERIENSDFQRNFSILADLLNHAPLARYATVAELPLYWRVEIGKAVKVCGEATALSVLRKLEEKGGQYSPIINELRIDILRDRTREESRLSYISEMYGERINRNGDYVRFVKAGYSEREADELIGYTYGDGTDLSHVAILAIWEQVERQRKNGERIDFNRRFTTRELNKQVRIQDSPFAWVDRVTFPIREAFRAVRQAIGDSASVKAVVNGYGYTETEETDEESRQTAVAYKRSLKYADIGGEQRQRTGDTSQQAVYSADEYILDSIAEYVDKMGLTVRQRVILNKRLQGYGQKAIATALGISKQGVQRNLKLIQQKAKKAGIFTA